MSRGGGSVATRVVKGGSAADAYFELVRRFPLRVVRDDKELDRAVKMVDELIDRDDLDSGEQDYLDALSTFVEKYEAERFPTPVVGGARMLRHLMEARGISQAELARDTEIAESTISQVLSGKRHLSRGHIGKLARYFAVDQGVFVGDW
jgi:HTH-type transcriptional regulator/antitoxin HigA